MNRPNPLLRNHLFQAFPALCLVALLFAATPAMAQLPAARLAAIFPPGGQAGQTVEVTATGTDLDDATTLRFSHPGITAKPVDGPTGSASNSTDRKFTLALAPDVPPGVYEVRLVGRYGMTNPRAFAVGTAPEIIAPPTNPAGKPAILAAGSVVNARAAANAADTYSVTLQHGQRVLIECAAREIDSRLSPVLLLSDADGRELARARHGGLMDFTAPRDGTYAIEVHDLMYRGGPDYFYRLSVGTGPHLDCVFPPAGPPGSKQKYTLLGRNLPGGSPSPLVGADGKPLEQLEVEIELPADASAPPRLDAAALLGTAGASTDAIAYRLRTPAGVSNPVLVGFATSPRVIEQEPNESAAQAQKLSPPCEVAGRFYPHDDADTFTFDAAKGDAWWIEIISDRLGPPTSPSLLIQKVTKTANGEEQVADVQDLGGPEAVAAGNGGKAATAANELFRTASRDFTYRLEAKEAGTYRLVLRDLFNTSHDNGALVYRLSIRRAEPDFRLLATPAISINANNNNQLSVAPQFLRKGGVVPIHLTLFREDGFNGEVTVEAQGLPVGLHCGPVTIPAGEATASLVVQADESAGAWAGSVRIVARADVGGKPRVREARIASVVWEPTSANQTALIQPARGRLTDEMTLAVSPDEIEPLSIEVTPATFEAKAGGKLQIPVKIKRRTEATADAKAEAKPDPKADPKPDPKTESKPAKAAKSDIKMEIKQPLKLKVAGLPGMGNAKEVTLDPKADGGTVELDLAQLRLPPGTYTFYIQTQTQMKYERSESAAEKPAKPGDAPKAKKSSKDAQVLFYSPPLTLKILPKDAKG